MRKGLIIILCLAVLMGIALEFVHRWSLRTFGEDYDPDNIHDMQKLVVIAENSRPLREALERFKHDRGVYPNASNLFSSYLPATNRPADDFSDWAGWRYLPASTNSYTLFYQANWDGGLWYDHLVNGTDQWYLSDSGAPIDLTQKLRQK